MKIGLTGASGFLGQYLGKQLLAENHDLKTWERNPECSIFPNAHAFDLSSPDEIDLSGIEVFVHSAAYIPKSFSDPSEAPKCWMQNAFGTQQLLQVAESAGVKTFIYLSSGQIYDWQSAPAKEEDLINPMYRAVPYLMSKADGDCFVRAASMKSKMRIIILRPSSIYGIGMKESGLLPRLIKTIKANEKPVIGNYIVDLVHVSDVSQMVSLAIKKNISGAFNVGGNSILSSFLIDRLYYLLQKEDIKIRKSVEPRGDIENGHPPLNIEKAKAIGYNPILFNKGLFAYVEGSSCD